MDHFTLAVAADMALQAYRKTVRIQSIDCFTIKRYSHGNIQWFSARRGGDLWLVFCGTNETADWMTNLDIQKTNTSCGMVHEGFNNALDSVWISVIEEVFLTQLVRLNFVGHSMGGALAAIAASRFIFNQLCPRTYLWTFGQPRCGDKQWADLMKQQLNGRYVRVLNAGDIVPYVPTRLRFSHAGQEIFFDKDGTTIDPTFWDRVSAAVDVVVTRFWSSFVWLDAHSMNRYRSNILSLLEER